MMSSEIREAIELHAMAMAEEFLKSQGWEKVENVSQSKPYDFKCGRGRETLFVEVKELNQEERPWS
jgi:hypothetical protein